jgi:nitroreductase
MMLEAESLGISSCIIGALGNEITGIQQELSKKAKEHFNINDNQIIAGIITLGYELEPKQTTKQRKSFDEVVSVETLGQKF